MQDDRARFRREARSARAREVIYTGQIIWAELLSLFIDNVDRLNELVDQRREARETRKWAKGCLANYGRPAANVVEDWPV